MPGDGPTTVIDRETGHASSWPGLPPMVVQETYRARRDGIVASGVTVDPGVGLRRDARRRPTPTVAAHLSLRDERHTARGAKGDQEVRHHRLVRDYLDDLPEGWLVRGGDRHAELIALSDALYALDRDRLARGGQPVVEDEARRVLRDARLEVLHVREPGDPAGARPAGPCESCLTALVFFGVLPWPRLAGAQEWRPRPEAAPRSDRFPPEVAAVLAEGGWSPEDTDDALADAAIERATAVAGHRHRHAPFPAARQALIDFPGLVCGRRGPGRRHWIRTFEINPVAAAHSADILADLGAVLGARLFPLGAEGDGDTMLAVDERSRVFALDQAGEWFLGDTVDAALVNLVTGGPVARIRDDGGWD
jgi:hypothetical protein